MQKIRCSQYLAIILFFLFALALEVLPWPQEWQGWQPAWLVMVLMYWIIALPHKINIGAAFWLGLGWDFLTGSLLGMHAFVLVIFAYLISVNYQGLRNLAVWIQALLLIIAVAAIRIGLFLIALLLYHASFNPAEFYGALLSGLLWPWVAILLRKVCCRLNLD